MRDDTSKPLKIEVPIVVTLEGSIEELRDSLNELDSHLDELRTFASVSVVGETARSTGDGGGGTSIVAQRATPRGAESVIIDPEVDHTNPTASLTFPQFCVLAAAIKGSGTTNRASAGAHAYRMGYTMVRGQTTKARITKAVWACVPKLVKAGLLRRLPERGWVEITDKGRQWAASGHKRSRSYNPD